MSDEATIGSPELSDLGGGEPSDVGLESLITEAAGEPAQTQTQESPAESLILGKFKTEDEAAQYIKGLEGQVEAKQQETISNLGKIRVGAPVETPAQKPVAPTASGMDTAKLAEELAISEEGVEKVAAFVKAQVQQEIQPIVQKDVERADMEDAKVIAQYPNHEKYHGAMSDFLQRNPRSSMLEAFKAVADPKDLTMTKSAQSKEQIDLKRQAFSESGGGAIVENKNLSSGDVLEQALGMGKYDSNAAEKQYFGVTG